MNLDHTQPQSDYEQKRARELSERPTRPPLEVPGYEARQFLGAGAYGEVWVAVDKNTGRRVAIKFLNHRTAMDWTLLSGEVEKLIFLSADRYVVQLLDVGWDAEPPYYVMEYVEAGSLEQLLESGKPLSVSEAVELFREIVIGVAHAHRKGVLHCDLKPANVLLDHDRRPRLADFGQSRLSHDQRPSLGTLFYMAPEQADLRAVPDAGWDIYALGALLHRMLTGVPPFRDEKTVSEIDSSVDLEDRLRRYRDLIAKSPRPRIHRTLAGVDRSLADILDRCLDRNPETRYRDVQSILNALDERARYQQRRPLLVLGLVGPLVLLSILSLFAWRGYSRAILNTTQAVAEGTRESNQLTARFASTVVSNRLNFCMRGVEAAAKRPDFQQQLQHVLNDPKIAELLQQLNRTDIDAPTQEALRKQLEQDPKRLELDKILTEHLQDPSLPAASSWFVTDHLGLHIASAFRTRPTSVVGLNFAYRSYFNGKKDLPAGERAPLLTQTHLSDVFQSTATFSWKLAVSTPIRIVADDKSEQVVGLVALTMDLGEFTRLFRSPERFVVIVDGREGDHYGQVLQHPLFDTILEQAPRLPLDLGDPQYRVPLQTMLANPRQIYRDPLGEHPEGKAFHRDWIATLAPVRLGEMAEDEESSESLASTSSAVKSPEGSATSPSKTGFVVLVQDDYAAATTPVRALHRELVPLGFWAILATTLATVLLWGVVYRLLRSGRGPALVRTMTEVAPIHNMETVELPSRLR